MSIVILDTGCANLASLTYAIQRLGYDPIISCDENTILTSTKLFLPGVGSAQAAMQYLKQRQLIKLINAYKQPVLGICLGMQLLARYSEEGNTTTLGIINENIIRIQAKGLSLPHMGWNTVITQTGHPLFKHIDDNNYFYFTHNFALPLCSATIAQVDYGLSLTAAVQKDNFYGVQFHPERSGKVGAKLLQNFLEM